jgi:hypothetical protein
MVLFNLQNVGLNIEYFIKDALRFFTPKIASKLIVVIEYNYTEICQLKGKGKMKNSKEL